MKKIIKILLFLLLITGCHSYRMVPCSGQYIKVIKAKPEQMINIDTIKVDYLVMFAVKTPHENRVSISIDFGGKNFHNFLADSTGEQIDFQSSIQAINYLSEHRWDLISFETQKKYKVFIFKKQKNYE